MLSRTKRPKKARIRRAAVKRYSTRFHCDIRNTVTTTAAAKLFTRSIGRHLAAFTAVWNSSVNSYRRLWDADFRNVEIVSDHGRRDGLIRIVESRYGGDRIELRTPDALTNPYLAIALCLQSMASTAAGKDEAPARKTVLRLPQDLATAVQAFSADDVVSEALGEKLRSAFVTLKKSELEFYRSEVPTTDFRYNAPEIFDFDAFVSSGSEAPPARTRSPASIPEFLTRVSRPPGVSPA